MAGRSTKLTDDLQNEIVGFVEQGNYFSVACELAGVSAKTGYEWLHRGRGKHSTRKSSIQFAVFAVAIKKAESIAESKAIIRIQEAAMGGACVTRKTTTRKDGSTVVEEVFTSPSWQADAWYLERKFPERWGRRDRTPIDIDYDSLTDEQLERIAAGENPLAVLASTGAGEVSNQPPTTGQESTAIN